LDKFLAGHGVPLRFARLVDDCPIALPEPRELPCIGHWRFDLMKAARQPLAEAVEKATSPGIAKAPPVARASSWTTLTVSGVFAVLPDQIIHAQALRSASKAE
jgi:hypothetical protein